MTERQVWVPGYYWVEEQSGYVRVIPWGLWYKGRS